MKKILLAEHDSFLIGVYASQLRNFGYSVSVAPDGEIIISRIKSINPDLLVLNTSMPKVDLLNVLKAIRNDSELADLKVVLLANFRHDEEIQRISKFNVSGYFTKVDHTAIEFAQEIKKILS